MQKGPLLDQIVLLRWCILVGSSTDAELIQLVLQVLCTSCQAWLSHELDLEVKGTIWLQKWHDLVLWQTEQLKGPSFLSLDGHDLFFADRDPLYIALMIDDLSAELESEDLNSSLLTDIWILIFIGSLLSTMRVYIRWNCQILAFLIIWLTIKIWTCGLCCSCRGCRWLSSLNKFCFLCLQKAAITL